MDQSTPPKKRNGVSNKILISYLVKYGNMSSLERVKYTYNSSSLRQENGRFKGSLSYTEKPLSQKRRLGGNQGDGSVVRFYIQYQVYQSLDSQNIGNADWVWKSSLGVGVGPCLRKSYNDYQN